MPIRVPVKDFVIYVPVNDVRDRMFEFGYTETPSGKPRRYVITSRPGMDYAFLRFWQIVEESSRKGKYAFNPWADQRTRDERLKESVQVKTVEEASDDGLSFETEDYDNKSAQIDHMFDPANTLRVAAMIRKIAETLVA